MRRRAALAALGLAVAIGAAIFFWRRAPAPAPRARSSEGAARSGGGGAAAGAERRWPIVLSQGSADDSAAAGGELSGRVLSTTTFAGVPRAELAFRHQGTELTASGDGEGNFIFRAPEPGRYELISAGAPGYLPFSSEVDQSPIALTARAGVRVRGATLYLSPAVDYTGVVEDRSGAPAAGAEVRRLGALDGEPDSFTSDARGQFVFHAADDEVFVARHPRLGRGRAALDGAAQRTHRLVIRLDGAPPDGGAPPAAATIAGVVVDERGAPIEGALVLAVNESAERQATTRAGGHFTVEGLDAGGDYRVSARARGLQGAAAESVRAGAAEVRLVLRAGGGLRGVVRDAATGKPLASFSIAAVERRGALERGDGTSISVFGAEGRYELRGLSPGAYAVTALAHGHAPAQERIVEIPAPPADLVQADFALTAGGRLSGVVRDAAPIAGARVSLEGGALLDGAPIGTQSSTTTDGAGRFELRGLSAGLHSIFVAAENHHGRILSGLKLDESGDLGPLTVELAPTAPGEEPSIELVGVGAVLQTRGDGMAIVAVVPGGGAAAAGLAPGDEILTIDGARAADLGFAGSIEHIRGPEGSTVTLGVRRKSDGAVADVVAIRKRVVSPAR